MLNPHGDIITSLYAARAGNQVHLDTESLSDCEMGSTCSLYRPSSRPGSRHKRWSWANPSMRSSTSSLSVKPGTCMETELERVKKALAKFKLQKEANAHPRTNTDGRKSGVRSRYMDVFSRQNMLTKKSNGKEEDTHAGKSIQTLTTPIVRNGPDAVSPRNVTFTADTTRGEGGPSRYELERKYHDNIRNFHRHSKYDETCTPRSAETRNEMTKVKQASEKRRHDLRDKSLATEKQASAIPTHAQDNNQSKPVDATLRDHAQSMAVREKPAQTATHPRSRRPHNPHQHELNKPNRVDHPVVAPVRNEHTTDLINTPKERQTSENSHENNETSKVKETVASEVCPFCSKPISSLQQLPCGHKLCSRCINRMLDRGRRWGILCPVCKCIIEVIRKAPTDARQWHERVSKKTGTVPVITEAVFDY
ncbi:hypothetical protein DPMN_074404 [Dreissena polymorpha]|uniref:RING-type domain-containing protein n=1 Tax=Dreissena polymorpha TaxID=45954 RepID=A0A9D3YF73_DREPO|nr:hypothetical protein DPMN_074404 [Dreissena polymorpha]